MHTTIVNGSDSLFLSDLPVASMLTICFMDSRWLFHRLSLIHISEPTRQAS